MMKILKNILVIQIILILVFAVSAKSLASAVYDIDKTLVLSPGTPHFLIFDEKIVNYKFENEKDFNAEILSNIFNNRQELLIKPVKNLNNKLTVRTASKIYNFDIQFNQTALQTDKKQASSEDTFGMTDFDLDNPPKVNK